MSGEGADRPGASRLPAILARLEAHAGPFGQWPTGAHLFSDSAEAPVLEELRRALAAEGWVEVFDWVAWADEAKRYIADPARVAQAERATLRKLVTTNLRADRFTSGHFLGMVENGHLAAVVRRIVEVGMG